MAGAGSDVRFLPSWALCDPTFYSQMLVMVNTNPRMKVSRPQLPRIMGPQGNMQLDQRISYF
jgi:hypothetical protein